MFYILGLIFSYSIIYSICIYVFPTFLPYFQSYFFPLFLSITYYPLFSISLPCYFIFTLLPSLYLFFLPFFLPSCVSLTLSLVTPQLFLSFWTSFSLLATLSPPPSWYAPPPAVRMLPYWSCPPCSSPCSHSLFPCPTALRFIAAHYTRMHVTAVQRHE